MDSVVHFEIPYEDKDRALGFYSDVFGWKMNDMPEMNYTIVHTVDIDENQMPKSRVQLMEDFTSDRILGARAR